LLFLLLLLHVSRIALFVSVLCVFAARISFYVPLSARKRARFVFSRETKKAREKKKNLKIRV